MNMISELMPNRTKWKSILMLTGYIGLMILMAVIFSKYVNKESLQEIIRNSGQLGIIVYFLIETIYVTFTPLLNTFILIFSGYVFGGHVGFIINFFSSMIGLLLIVFLVKQYGRPLLQKVISHKFYERFDQIIQKVGPITLLIVYVLPFTPDDELTYIVAAGPIGFKRFILPILFGTIAKSAYSYIGDLGTRGITISIYFRISMMILGIIVVGLQEHIIKKPTFLNS